MLETKKVVIMTQNVKFAISAKNTLESTGQFEVFTTTSARGVLDYLQDNTADVLLADFRVQDITGRDVMDNVRTLQPRIAVIGAPEHPSMTEIAQRYNMQGVVTIPYPLRRLPKLLNDAIYAMQSGHSTPIPMATMVLDEKKDEPIDESPKNKTLEFWVSDTDGGSTIVEFIPIEVDPETGVYRVLAEEEPPMPMPEDATVSDLRQELETSERLKQPINVLSSMNSLDNDNEAINTAAVVLETALDESTPVEQFSLEKFMDRVQEKTQFGETRLKPLPSWIEESQKYIREPDFLKADLPGYSQPLEYGESVTIANASQEQTVEEVDASEFLTDPMQPVQRSRPPRPADSLPKPPAPPEMPERRVKRQDNSPRFVILGAEDDTIKVEVDKLFAKVIADTTNEEYEIEESVQSFEDSHDTKADAGDDFDASSEEIRIVEDNRPPQILPEDVPDSRQMTPPPQVIEKPKPTPARQMPFTHIEDTTDPKLAQLAVTLIQVSLELTAEATLLTKDGLIVAYAGQLPKEDIDELRDIVGIDWTSNGDKSRIRFVSLPNSGTDYMLFTRQTDENYALSMIFAGRMPVSVIRRQGKRLAEALTNLPEDEIIEEFDTPVLLPIEFPTPDEVTERIPQTFVWLLSNPDDSLTNNMRKALHKGLKDLLKGAKWKIQYLEILEDHIYLFADVPDGINGHNIIQDLQRASGELLRRAGHDVVWDDAYLILQPGREMGAEEIQRFINFVRG